MAGSVVCGVAAVRQVIEEAARRTGRDPKSVTLIAVTKGQGVEALRQALEAGVKDFGENRVHELIAKYQGMGDAAAGVEWHFIGRLQTNKVRRLLTSVPVRLIHSLDRPSLAEAISNVASKLGRVQEVLVQVNVSGEVTKTGVVPAEVVPFIAWASRLEGLRITGLMTMAPEVVVPEEARPFFRRLKQIFDEVAAQGIPGVDMLHLSMGMSGDYAVAVEEGATMVRVGRAIFGHIGGAGA